MRQCPKCGSPRIHRSRSRGVLEQLRKTVTSQRLHRCHACGWRGWGLETENGLEPEVSASTHASVDLTVIDAVVTDPSRKRESTAAAGDAPRRRRRRTRTSLR